MFIRSESPGKGAAEASSRSLAGSESSPNTFAAYAAFSPRGSFWLRQFGPLLYARKALATLPPSRFTSPRMCSAASIKPSWKSNGFSFCPSAASKATRVFGMIWKWPSAPAGLTMFLPRPDSVRHRPSNTEPGTPAYSPAFAIASSGDSFFSSSMFIRSFRFRRACVQR